MRLEYDLNVGALYISLSSHEVARTRIVDDNTCVDFDADGMVVGIEIVSTDSPWPVEIILSEYRLPPGEIEQFSKYFRPPMADLDAPGSVLTPKSAVLVTRHESPTMRIVPAGVAA